MDIPVKTCACKGIRKCLLCDKGIDDQVNNAKYLKTYIYCSKCKNKAFDELIFYQKHLNQNHDSIEEKNDDNWIEIDGVYLKTDVITEEEQQELIQQIDSFQWIQSQSGRRKQDFGPKINFRKKKINFSSFFGLPRLDMAIIEKIKSERLPPVVESARFFKTIPDAYNETILNYFHPVEICHLEYCPERGSSIDPHFDDFWIWGERLVTLNLLSTTVLTLTLPNSNDFCIRIICPPRSILVIYGDARHIYHHSIHRSDIIDRRVAITYRELPVSYFNQSSHSDIAEEFLERSKNMID